MGAFDDILGAPEAAPKTGAFDDILGPHAKAPPPPSPLDRVLNNPVARVGYGVDRALRRGVTQGIRNAADFGAWASENPLARGVGAVLGTTERMGESGTSNLLDRATGHKPRTNPIAGALDPEGDPRVTHRLEHQEWDTPIRALNAHLPAWAQGSVPTGGWRQTGLDLLTQTAHDPLTYLPGVDLFTVGSRLWRAAHAGEEVARTAESVGRLLGDTSSRAHITPRGVHPEGFNEGAARLQEHLLSNLTTSHDPLKGMHQSGLNITRAREGGARHLQAQRETQYAPVPERQATLAQLGQTLKHHGLTGQDITSRNPLGIHNAINHIPLHQRLALHQENKLTDAALWREGSPQARGQMRARGYTPSAEDAALPNANLVQGDYGRRYIPEQSIQDQAVADEATAARGFSINRGGVKRSAHDTAKHGAPQNLAPLDERFANRLQSSAYLEPKRRAEQSIIRDLGLTPTQVGRTDARIAELQGRLALTPKAKPTNLFRYQSTPGGPELSRDRGGTYFTYGDKNSDVGGGYSDLQDGDRGTADKNIGGQHRVDRIATPKNPLDISELPEGKRFPNRTSMMGLGVPHALRPGKPTASNFSEIASATEGDLFHPSYIAEQRKHAARYLKALGVPKAEAERIAQEADGRTLSDRLGAELARKHGYDAVIHQGNLDESNAKEFFALHPSAHSAPVPEKPGSGLLERHIEKYKALHERQTTAAYKDALLREKHLVPGGSVADAKHEALRQQLAQTPEDHPDREGLERAVAAHENPLSGILRGKRTAEQIAKRDVAWHGGDASAAFNEKGSLQGTLSTGASGEKLRQRRLAATGAETRRAATKSALRDLDERLSKMGLKQQKRVTKKVTDLRTKQAIRERTHLASLAKHATPKVKPEPETPNIFDLPHLSSRKLTHELPKSSPVMKRIAELRDARERRGGGEFAPLLHSLPTDTTKATGKVHRLADRAERDAAVKRSALETAAKEQAAKKARNAGIAKVKKGVEEDPLYQGKIAMPSPLHDRLFGPKMHTEPGVGEGMARGIQGATFSLPFTHGIGNVAEQQVFAGGGLGSLARGAAEAVKIARKDPEALKRLDFTKQHGAIHEHGFESRVPQWNPGSKWLNKGLTKGHEGQASVLMHKYLHEGMTPEDAAEEVRKTFGRPNETAKEVKKLGAAGGVFPNWLLATVPRSAKKMAGSAKSRNLLKQFARVDEDANADIFEPEYGVEWNPGGFAPRAASLALRPAPYFGGESMDTALHDTATQGKRSGWDAAKGYVPYMGLSNLMPWSQVLDDAQRARRGVKKLPQWAKMMTLGGSYFTPAETRHHKYLREAKREGLLRE